MKITQFVEPDSGDLLADNAASTLGRSFLGRSGRVERSLPPGAAAARRNRRPIEPPPLHEEAAPVSVSVEAAYLMVGDRYDPRFISPNDLGDMMELLIAAGIATRADQALLVRGPYGKGYPFLESGMKRDIVAEWQELLARGVGRSNLTAVTRATRALNILGQVSVTRLPK